MRGSPTTLPVVHIYDLQYCSSCPSRLNAWIYMNHISICIRLVEATWLGGKCLWEQTGCPFLSALQTEWQTNGEKGIMNGVHATERQGWIHCPKCMHNWVPITNLLGLCKLLKFLFLEVWILHGGCFSTYQNLVFFTLCILVMTRNTELYHEIVQLSTTSLAGAQTANFLFRYVGKIWVKPRLSESKQDQRSTYSRQKRVFVLLKLQGQIYFIMYTFTMYDYGGFYKTCLL